MSVLGTLLLISSLLPRAHGVNLAYVDPLSGSVFLQMVAAGVLGALFVAKSSLLRIQNFFRGLWAKILRR